MEKTNKNIVRLSESQLKGIIEESVRMVLKEHASFSLNSGETSEPLLEMARINTKEGGKGRFPYNTYEVKIWSNDHNPPHFHVISDGWDISLHIANGALYQVNRKGENKTVYSYIIKNAPLWINEKCALLPTLTNKQNAESIWIQLHTQ